MRQIAGFTLIELIITMSVIVLLAGSGMAAFLNYQARRQAQDDATAVADRLRTIQTKATAVVVPGGCTSVTSYTVTLSGTGLTVAATCPGVGAVEIPDLALSLTKSVFQSPKTIVFDSRTITASRVTVGICGNNSLWTVEVNEAANIGRPVAAGSC